MRILLVIIFSFSILSCGQQIAPSSTEKQTLTYSGYLHGNTSTPSNSRIEYNNKYYKIGSNSTTNLQSSIAGIAIGNVQATILETSGSVSVVKIEFDGAIEDTPQGSSTEPRIQVYKFLFK